MRNIFKKDQRVLELTPKGKILYFFVAIVFVVAIYIPVVILLGNKLSSSSMFVLFMLLFFTGNYFVQEFSLRWLHKRHSYKAWKESMQVKSVKKEK